MRLRRAPQPKLTGEQVRLAADARKAAELFRAEARKVRARRDGEGWSVTEQWLLEQADRADEGADMLEVEPDHVLWKLWCRRAAREAGL